MQKIKVEEFVMLTTGCPVIDVRSPGEFAHAHIPGAYNIPLFSDEERKIVGTEYKQQSREQAIKTGLDFFGVKMRKIVEEVEKIGTDHGSRSVLLHCWRGGMRSAGVAWLLDLYGFKVHTLAGGYKAYRNWVLAQFEKPYRFKIVGGYTGSGKTMVLKELAKTECVIDLEQIANHKGSAFGGLGEDKQPSPEMFENILGMQLHAALSRLPESGAIWLEDESRRIGDINLPAPLWDTMRRSHVYFLDIPFEQRLDYITAEYGRFKKEELVNSTIRIQKRLGGLNTKNAINHLLENNTKECFRILLEYYDKFYGNSLQERKGLDSLLTTLNCETTDAKINCTILTNYNTRS